MNPPHSSGQPSQRVILPSTEMQALFEQSFTIANSANASEIRIEHLIDALLAHHPETVEERMRAVGWTRPE
ncbi:hypothetical protein ABZ319_18855 [Nocardia sp. NPDC005978]|uniref:hypothetical protein n=1 Tax=Nocardia sp. NPDC005978 TaxID=3156725 RepID=UPI0033A3AA08